MYRNEQQKRELAELLGVLIDYVEHSELPAPLLASQVIERISDFKTRIEKEGRDAVHPPA